MALSDKMRKMLDKGVAASKELAGKAGAKAKELGTMGMMKLEILQLRSRADKLTLNLGKEVYGELVERNASEVKKDSPQISRMLKEIDDLRVKIARKEKEFRAIGGKAEDLAPAKID